MDDFRLVLYDLDGTLITSYMDNPDKDFHYWADYPQTAAKVERLRRAGIKQGVVTNQAGVGFGYTTPEEWEQKRDRVCSIFGFQPSDFFVCFAHPKADPPYNDSRECRRRKPAAGMIFEAMEHFGVDPARVIFIGDMESDYEAARHARIAFAGAGEFFDSALDVPNHELRRVPPGHPARIQPVPMPTMSHWA